MARWLVARDSQKLALEIAFLAHPRPELALARRVMAPEAAELAQEGVLVPLESLFLALERPVLASERPLLSRQVAQLGE